MPRSPCPPEEDIVRAITEAHWVPEENRASTSLFKGANISVSRLAILSLREIFIIFLRDFNDPQKSKLLGCGQINVGKLQDIGTHHINPQTITVEIAPKFDNPSHAEIPQNLQARKLIIKIIRALFYHFIR